MPKQIDMFDEQPTTQVPASASVRVAGRKRWSIWVREQGSDHDVELITMDGDPTATKRALEDKQLTFRKSLQKGGGKYHVAKYDYVRVVDNGK